MARVVCNIPLNRVEGDLELKVAMEDGRVADVWSIGSMFRGFERMMIGRGALDGLVITPRICGICSTTHLTAAALALDLAAGVEPPPNAVRHRNLALMCEQVQSDVRQSLLMFMPDFAVESYRDQPLYAEAVQRYAPLRGERAVNAVRETKRILEVIALLGGQWPHSSYMVPGGVAFHPGIADLMECRHILVGHRRWYEERVLGCESARWLAIQDEAGLDTWLEESPAHAESDTGFLLRFGRAVGLERIGQGYGQFLSYGSLPIPADSAVTPFVAGSPTLIPSGFFCDGESRGFDQALIAEHVAHSWYDDYAGGLHPTEGITEPYALGDERGKYSLAKAPRYDGRPAETGPLAERLLMGDPLFLDLFQRHGDSALVRQLARITRPALLFDAMLTWVDELTAHHRDSFYIPTGHIMEGEGVGLLQAARGALGHWVRIEKGCIAHYQIVTPTAWNGSPRDSDHHRGPWEEALIGTPVADPDQPVEIGHVVRSFDPCLVCTVHRIGGKEPWLRL